MDRSWVYRVITYSLLTIVAVVFLTPTFAGWFGKDDQLPAVLKKHIKNKILLGLDLQGGLHIVYEVQVDKAVSDKADRLASDLEERLRRDKHVKDVKANRLGRDQIELTFKDPNDVKKLDRE